MACVVCSGSKGDHGPGKTRHVYTETPGQLQTPEQQAKTQDPGSRVVMMPQPSHPTMVDRLVETLLIKGLLGNEDVIYIMLGKPRSEGA